MLGYGPRCLYEEAFIKRDESASRSTHLLVSFFPGDLIILEKLRIHTIKSSHPNVSLTSHKVDFHDRVMLADLGKYLQNDNGGLWTSIIYFKDKAGAYTT
jgi:hypothetical protein